MLEQITKPSLSSHSRPRNLLWVSIPAAKRVRKVLRYFRFMWSPYTHKLVSNARRLTHPLPKQNTLRWRTMRPAPSPITPPCTPYFPLKTPIATLSGMERSRLKVDRSYIRSLISVLLKEALGTRSKFSSNKHSMLGAARRAHLAWSEAQSGRYSFK